jgi:hypothetical protein
MLKGAHNIFVVVVNFISNNSKAKHAIIGLFKVTNMSNIAMAPKLQDLFNIIILIEKIIVDVKDEKFNLQTCASALNSII